MRSFLLAAALVPLLAGATPASAQELEVSGSGLTRDIACNGKDVSIFGAANRIKLTGECRTVTVAGADHVVSFEVADVLQVEGAKLRVTGGTVNHLRVDTADNVVAATIAAKDSPAEVVVSGAKHEVALKLTGPTVLKVVGADHKVQWTLASGAPEPDVSNAGVHNTVERK